MDVKRKLYDEMQLEIKKTNKQFKRYKGITNLELKCREHV